jgi:hypothetical protein
MAIYEFICLHSEELVVKFTIPLTIIIQSLLCGCLFYIKLFSKVLGSLSLRCPQNNNEHEKNLIMFVNADQKFENVASKLFLFKYVVIDGTKCVNYQSSKHVYISQTNLWPIL